MHACVCVYRHTYTCIHNCCSVKLSLTLLFTPVKCICKMPLYLGKQISQTVRKAVDNWDLKYSVVKPTDEPY